MIGLGIAFIVVGIVLLFLVPSAGIVVGVLGLVLALLWVAGVGRSGAAADAYIERHRF